MQEVAYTIKNKQKRKEKDENTCSTTQLKHEKATVVRYILAISC